MSTPDAATVRHQIATLLGWRDLVTGPYLVHDAPADGDLPHALMGYTPDGAWQHVPDWTGDTGAALALCLDIARRHVWLVMVDEDGASFVEQEIVYDTHVVYAPVMDAPSLALLALAALEAEVQP